MINDESLDKVAKHLRIFERYFDVMFSKTRFSNRMNFVVIHAGEKTRSTANGFERRNNTTQPILGKRIFF